MKHFVKFENLDNTAVKRCNVRCAVFLIFVLHYAVAAAPASGDFKTTIDIEKNYQEAYGAYMLGIYDLAMEKIETVNRDLKEANDEDLKTCPSSKCEALDQDGTLQVRAYYLHSLILLAQTYIKASSTARGILQGIVGPEGTDLSTHHDPVRTEGVIGLSYDMLNKIEAVGDIALKPHDPNILAPEKWRPSFDFQKKMKPLNKSELKNERIGIVVPTHPPYYSYARRFLKSCLDYNCTTTVDIWFIFTNNYEQEIFEKDDETNRLHKIGLWRAMVCGDRCLGGGCEPNTKKFVALRYLFDMISTGTIYPYRYVVCFDSETVFVRNPVNLPIAIQKSDERMTYFHTYHRGELETTIFPAYALLRWAPDHPAQQYLKDQTENFHLHGWWSELPFYDMGKVHDFFLKLVGPHLVMQNHDLTAAVIAATIELGNWAFEHNIYKYYNIMEYNYTITNLHKELSFLNIQEDKRSWLEVFNLYVGNNTNYLHQLFDFTKVLWCAACVLSDHISPHEIYFQFHGDKSTSCIGGYI